MDYKDFVQFSVPLSHEKHDKLQKLSKAQNKTMRQLFYELLERVFNEADNQKILKSLP